MPLARKTIAVIGAGIFGLSAAWLLARRSWSVAGEPGRIILDRAHASSVTPEVVE